MIARDKLMHFGVGFLTPFIGTAGVWGLYGFNLGMLLVGSVIGGMVGHLLAYAKEEYDKRHPLTHTADGWDAAATELGAGVGTAICAFAALGYIVVTG
jgi:hypothetical protein